ncbi:TetR/AcrR family transcriptional regulator [Cryobacterium soli]|uniref:TetR/AcrR family transcriptional regulator n=1 Tax=Cryobacterium soli TaxID=2220095 RepID=UPI000E766014|nr:TetR/AcrR family transcriptional regulator [Cryobacterium soli]
MELRVDARDNRERIIDAAEALFATRGIAVPMSDVARSAGVGAATLSRRFPTKDALVDAVFARQLGWWLSAIQAAEQAEDGWQALSTLLEESCVQQAHDRACAELVVRAFLQGNTFEAERNSARTAVERIIERAQREGAASSDVRWDDVVLLIEANAGAASLTSSDPEAGARRLVGHFLRSFAAR